MVDIVVYRQQIGYFNQRKIRSSKYRFNHSLEEYLPLKIKNCFKQAQKSLAVAIKDSKATLLCLSILLLFIQLGHSNMVFKTQQVIGNEIHRCSDYTLQRCQIYQSTIFGQWLLMNMCNPTLSKSSPNFHAIKVTSDKPLAILKRSKTLTGGCGLKRKKI